MYERNYHGKVLEEDKQSKPKKKIFPWKTVLITTLCIVLFGGFVVLTQLNRLQVRTIEVVGAISADPKDVSEFVTNTLTGKWLYVFPKTSIVLLPDTTLERSIQRAFPKFETISVARSGAQTITITVTEYEGTQLWCDELTKECSFMSTTGVVFAPAPFFSGSAYLKIYGGEKGEYPFVPFHRDELSTIALYLDKLHAINIDATEFYFFTSPEKLIISFYHNSGQTQIIIDPSVPTDTTLQSLFTALRTPPLSTRYRDSTSMLNYIDLRLPNKVVYKFQ